MQSNVPSVFSRSLCESMRLFWLLDYLIFFGTGFAFLSMPYYWWTRYYFFRNYFFWAYFKTLDFYSLVNRIFFSTVFIFFYLNFIVTFLISPPVYVCTFCKLGLIVSTGFFLVRLEVINPNFLLEAEWDYAKVFLNLGLVLLKGILNCLVALLI